MKTHLRTCFIFIFVFSAPFLSLASHLMGGEITWQCQANGQFLFTLKLYRDCNGIPGYFTTQTMNSNSPAGSIPMYFTDTNDISPVCNSDTLQPHLFCATASGFDTGAVEEFIYHSHPVTLNGIPPGWRLDIFLDRLLQKRRDSQYDLRKFFGQGKNVCLPGKKYIPLL
jgi:hypothetical protein